MAEDLEEHIGAAELAKLLEQSRRWTGATRSPADGHPHLGKCTSCREQFEELALLDRKLKVNRAEPAEVVERRRDCPSLATWREIAGGLTPAAPTLGYIEHASGCGYCGPLLHRAVAEMGGLSQSLSAEERKYIASLESASLEWQQRLAGRIAGKSAGNQDRKLAGRWPGWLAIPQLAIAGASLLAMVAVGSWVVAHRNQQPTADRLLARAYTEKRTMELRMAGADYAPLRIERGPQASFTNRPAALLKAESLIATQLQSHPADPAWLQAKAQADVLEGKYDAAVESLRRALELEPNSASLLTDLATAYFQRAQQEDKKDDLGAAYEYLSQALKLRPGDPVALFNRAIISEHQFLYRQALDDWDQYLRVDPTSQWVEEARNHANAVREILKQHGSKAVPLLSPASVGVLEASSSSAPEIDERIDEYLHEAVRSWLPQAYPERRFAADPDAQRALFFLAQLAQRQHSDHWLTDVIGGASSPHFSQALQALSRAVQSNDSGAYETSRQQSELAEHLFGDDGNRAGVLRAGFERAFAEQLTRRSEHCRRKAAAALKESEQYPYPWLQVQLGLEKGICSGLMGDLGADENAARRAMDRAEQSGYEVVYLRALGFLAGDLRETGNVGEGWGLLGKGLETFWSGQFPAMRGYNFYATAAGMAESEALPNLQLASWREAVALVESDEDVLLRGMADWSMADAASAARLPRVAERQYAEAARLFAAAPHNGASQAFVLENEIRMARLEGQQGRFDEAIARLTSIQGQILTSSNSYVVEIFYSTLGEVQLGGHHAAEAEQALRPAVALEEQNLASLGSEAERTSWSMDASPAYLALVEAELTQGRSQEALETYEWYLGAPLRARGSGRRRDALAIAPVPGDSRMVARRPLVSLSLPAKETVLTYAALPGGLAIWVYDDRGLEARWIPQSTDGLRESAERLHNLASDPESELSALRREAHGLYEELIAPVEERLGSERTLVVVAEGWLGRVPFEALLDSKGRYLVERGPIVHSLGEDSQARLRIDGEITADLPALIVGSTASLPGDGLIPLPDVTAEADSVARSFRFARVLEGGKASLSAVRSDLPGAAVFHFAGHSLVAHERAGLMLEGKSEDGEPSDPGLMEAKDVGQLQLRSLRLAVLSACSTASGSGGSRGFDSVASALLRAGVPHVVASRWAVDSTETRAFIGDFYRDALSGESVPGAIRLASQKMMANPSTSHPYYWSAFAAYGRP